MKKILLTAALAFATIIASAQFSILTSVNMPDEGLTKSGEESYDILGRYTIKDAIYATCIYNYESESEAELSDKLSLGIGYSLKVWKNLYAEPNYTMSLKEDEEGNREGSFNLGLSYKF